MKYRWIAVLLVLCLSFGLCGAAFADEESFEDCVDINKITEAGILMYQNVEARFDTVTNDSGAVGMGIMAWRALKALELLKRICAADAALSEEKLGTDLYNEVVNTDLYIYDSNGRYLDYAWHHRTFTADEIAAAKSLISTDAGIAAQKAQAKQDIGDQLKHGWNAGIRSDAALLYYTYAENHYGPGGVKTFLSAVRSVLGLSSSDKITSLDQFHGAVVQTKYCSENTNPKCNCARSRSYRFIKNTLGWDTAGNGGDNGGGDNGGSGNDSGDHDCPCKNFTDMPAYDNWAHAGIDFVVENGLFAGMSATTFSPDGTMTRAMMVTVLYRLAGEPDVSGTSPFDDVAAGKYYENAVIWASQNAIVNGVSSSRFNPNGNVTREQIVTFLFRYAQYKGVAGSLETTTLTGYSDAGSVSDFAYYSMIWAIQNGIIRGSSGRLYPGNAATRAEVAAIFMRYCETFN